MVLSVQTARRYLKNGKAVYLYDRSKPFAEVERIISFTIKRNGCLEYRNMDGKAKSLNIQTPYSFIH